MALDYALEPLRDVWEESQPLLEEHWRELAFFDDIPLAPRVDLYFGSDDRGMVRIFTARDAGRLVGYLAFMVDFGLHYGTSKQAMQDVLFLLPAYRNAGNGAGLILFAELALRAEGVQCVYQHVKHSHDFAPLLKHLGYQAVETIHVKRLDHGS